MVDFSWFVHSVCPFVFSFNVLQVCYILPGYKFCSFDSHVFSIWKTAIWIHILGVQSCIGENASKSSSSEKDLHNSRHRGENYGPECPSYTELLERVASSFTVPGVSIAEAQSSVDPECVKLQSGTDPSLPAVLHIAKARKLTVERSDPKKYVPQGNLFPILFPWYSNCLCTLLFLFLFVCLCVVFVLGFESLLLHFPK